jgi:hypothetical protein
MASIIQRIVPQTTRMSTAASGRFRMPNWIGVKIRFATRLMAMGRATSSGSRPRPACTKPKVAMMTG